jgi:Shikimate kinase
VPAPPDVRRIWIKGASGAGKTTLAKELARRLRLDYVELDALHHDPDWTPAAAELLQARVHRALDDARGWVVDGNYDSKLGGLVLDRAELIVWLDLPLGTKLTRLARRTFRRWLTREELWNGNRENLRDVFWGGDALFPWALRCHFRHRNEWPRLHAGRPLVRLHSVRDVQGWLAQVATSGSHGAPRAGGP